MFTHRFILAPCRKNGVLLFGNQSDIKATEFLRSTNKFYLKGVPGTRTAHRDVERRSEEEEENEGGAGGRIRSYSRSEVSYGEVLVDKGAMYIMVTLYWGHLIIL